MPAVRVVLVEPKNEGNIGAVARAMKNFGFDELFLVNPCPLGAEARQRAMHGVDILEAAHEVSDLDAAIEGTDLVVGTSGVDTENERRFARIAVSPRDMARRCRSMSGGLALLFGREDFGLLADELKRCDILVKIPATKEYPILNLSHAASILLYEFFTQQGRKDGARRASGFEKEKLHTALAELLDASGYPAHKIARTKIMFRRILGRAVPSKWEFHVLMGVFRRASNRIKRLERKR